MTEATKLLREFAKALVDDGPPYMRLFFTWTGWPRPAITLDAAVDAAMQEGRNG